MKTLSVRTGTGQSRILVGEAIRHLKDWVEASDVLLVADSEFVRLHPKALGDFPAIMVQGGESSKSLDTVKSLYDAFLARELERSSMVIAVGGGTVCDVVGFAAATYLRGLRFACVPTTLLAQVDAAVGGKNGVNFGGYKNLVGTIRQPEFILCDLDLLHSEPAHQRAAGFAEMVKSAAIADASLFDFLETQGTQALKGTRSALEKAVFDSIAVKVGVVSRDEREQGLRRILNFGHTVGHALEKHGGFSHGEAVSIGMVAAARLSVQHAGLPSSEATRLEKLLTGLGLPVRAAFDSCIAAEALRKDKKRSGDVVQFVLLKRIGEAVVAPLPLEEIEGVLDDLH